MHATDFAKQFDARSTPAMVVLFGTERHLKLSVINQLCLTKFDVPAEEAIGLARFPGKETDYRTVHDELAMVSMFSSEKLIVVEDADDFVSQYRLQLEGYLDKPSKKSLLVLDVKSWPKNTRLAKRLAKVGVDVECSELTGGRLVSWLTSQAKEQHGKQLTRDAAQLIPELAGTTLGLLDQELQKLATYVGDRQRIGVEDVQTLVGGWKAETTWTMVNAIRDGQPDIVLSCLNKLLHAGEAPQKILGGVNFVFRKIAQAVERSRLGAPLKAALKDAGVFPRDVDAVERYLRRIQRPRAERIISRLALADYGLKGGSRLPEQLQMEQLMLWLTGVIDDVS